MSDASANKICLLVRLNVDNRDIYPTTYKEVVDIETFVHLQAFAHVDTWRSDEVVVHVGIFSIRPQLPVN